MSQFFLEQNRLVVFVVVVVISAILGLKLAIEKKTLTDTAWTGNSWDVVQFYMKNSVRFVKKGVRLVPLIFASLGGGCKNTYYNFDFTVTQFLHPHKGHQLQDISIFYMFISEKMFAARTRGRSSLHSDDMCLKIIGLQVHLTTTDSF